jgi:hypothetical protein
MGRPLAIDLVTIRMASGQIRYPNGAVQVGEVNTAARGRCVIPTKEESHATRLDASSRLRAAAGIFCPPLERVTHLSCHSDEGGISAQDCGRS